MSKIFIIHGTEGYPEENWFPWLKNELENLGHQVFVPQFPSPPVVAAKITEWFEVWKEYEKYPDENSIIIGHSLGGIFTLRVLEKLQNPIKAAVFVGTPIGIRPILNYDRDQAFSGFDFNFQNIKTKAKKFVIYQSEDDPYVSLANGEELAEKLGVTLDFIPNAGHFNTRAGFTKFDELKEKLLTII